MKQPLAALPQTFAALADPTRLRILGLLLQDEVCVCHIHAALRIPQSKASRHLAYLRRTGLVEANKRGLWVYYKLAAPKDPATGAVLTAIREAIAPMDIVRQDTTRLARALCCVGPRRSERA